MILNYFKQANTNREEDIKSHTLWKKNYWILVISLVLKSWACEKKCHNQKMRASKNFHFYTWFLFQPFHTFFFYTFNNLVFSKYMYICTCMLWNKHCILYMYIYKCTCKSLSGKLHCSFKRVASWAFTCTEFVHV